MRTPQQLATEAQAILDGTPIDRPRVLMMAVQYRDTMRWFAAMRAATEYAVVQEVQ